MCILSTTYPQGLVILWIRGVESVDKPVDRIVDNSSLWISGELSTIRPQEDAGYPHFYPQLRGRPFALGKANLSSYTHIHRPYYYYCSNRYMLGSNNKVRREAV